MPVTVWLGSGYVTILAGSLTFNNAIGRRSQAGFIARTDTATHFEQDQQVRIYDTNGVLVFSGYITMPKEQKPGFQASLYHTVTCTDQHRLADKRVVAASYTNRTCGSIVQDIWNNILVAEGVTIGQIYDGLQPSLTLYPSTTLYPLGNVGLIPSATFTYSTVAQAFDALVKAASTAGVPYYWMFDQNKSLWFVPYTTVPGPAIDGSQIDDGRRSGVVPSVTRLNPDYRNTQYIVGGVAQTVVQTETRQGDGKTRAFTFSYGLNAVPSAFTVNGVSKTLGLKGTSGSQYYWAQGDSVIAQDTGQAILLSTDTISMTYIGQYPSVTISANNAQIAYSQALAGDSGIVESVQNDTTLTNVSNALTEASALLTRYAAQGAQFVFATLSSGFAPGQLCTVTYAPFGFNGVQMLVSDVAASDQQDGFNIWYTVTAVLGPYDMTWVDFFSTLLTQVQMANSINAGVSQSVNLLASFAASVVPLASLTVTAGACPLPATTQFPSTTLFPC